MKKAITALLVGVLCILVPVACTDLITSPERNEDEAKMDSLISMTQPISYDQALGYLIETFPGRFASTQAPLGPSHAILADPGLPSLDRGGFVLRRTWISSTQYTVIYSPHRGWAGPRGNAVHMNFSTWKTPVPYKGLDEGIALRRLKEQGNVHVSIVWQRATPCLYLYDSVSKARPRTNCLTAKKVQDKIYQMADDIRNFFATVLSIRITLSVARAFAYLLAGALVALPGPP